MVSVEGICDGLIAVFALERGQTEVFTGLVQANPRARQQIRDTPLGAPGFDPAAHALALGRERCLNVAEAARRAAKEGLR